jgi:uncharacterized protein (TIGR00369 family)
MGAEDLRFDVPPDYDKCFGCGKGNPIGLKLKFRDEGGVASCEFTPGPEYQGWPGVVHGGILSTILDEAMGWAAIFNGKKTVTGKLEVRFRRPAKVGQTLSVKGWLAREGGRFIVTKAEARDPNGNIVAEATGTMFVIP